MILKGMTVQKSVTQFGGSKGYLFWVSDCFDPPIYFVRADNFDEAFENFICDDRISRDITVDEDDLDDEDRAALADGDLSGTTWSDDGTLVWTETVNGVSLGHHD